MSKSKNTSSKPVDEVAVPEKSDLDQELFAARNDLVAMRAELQKVERQLSRLQKITDKDDGPLPHDMLLDLVEFHFAGLNKWGSREIYGLFRFVVEHHGMDVAGKVRDFLIEKNIQIKGVAKITWKKVEAWHRTNGESMEKNTTRPLRSDYENIPEADAVDGLDDLDGTDPNASLNESAIPISDIT